MDQYVKYLKESWFPFLGLYIVLSLSKLEVDLIRAILVLIFWLGFYWIWKRLFW